MDKLQARSMLEAMATEVIRIHTSEYEEFSSEIPHVVEGNKVPEAGVQRLATREYGLIGYVDELDSHDLWVAMVRQAIVDMPSARCKLIWRVHPEYEVETDFATGRDRHKAYFRLAWMKDRS
jgi:hypothetical protein